MSEPLTPVPTADLVDQYGTDLRVCDQAGSARTSGPCDGHAATAASSLLRLSYVAKGDRLG
ncbi:hypothetical protein [Streptomyces atroolivaceus]|uniref:Uncharacterized protein n=1 Tax=Streptomyces atroolivaceus TaxID=66869 RepID=A0ABV9VD75_STRAZ|nr:hypothetical protein [Streptomyces atroolivaceus]